MPTLPPTLALVVKLGVWALALGAFLAMLTARLAPVDARTRRLLGAALVGAFAGSKLLHGWARAEPGEASVVDTLLWWYGGDSTAGALIGAWWALWLAERGSEARRLADAMVAPAAVALIILACGASLWALRGANAGGATSLPWGMDFGDGLARHPLMLYEALFLAALLGGVRRLHGAPPGLRAGLFVTAYLGFTFASGFLRAPFAAAGLAELVTPRARMVLGLLSVEQCVCLAAIGMMMPAVRAAWLARAVVARRG